MIDFNEEVSKFQPSLEIDQAEEAIFKNDMTDLSDVIDTIMRGNQNTEE